MSTLDGLIAEVGITDKVDREKMIRAGVHALLECGPLDDAPPGDLEQAVLDVFEAMTRAARKQ